MHSIFNDYLTKQGAYYLLPDGFWVKEESGGLWSGAYKTADGITFTIAGSGGGGGTDGQLDFSDADQSGLIGPSVGSGVN